MPFIYIVIAGLQKDTDKTKIINIFISIVLGSLIAGWHYFRPEIIQKIWYEPITEPRPIFNFESLRVMTIGLWEELLSPPIFIIFVIGLIYFIWKYKGKYKNIVLLWFFVPWLIIMLMPHHKLPEYGLGFIPAMILIGAILITVVRKLYIKKILVFFLITIGVFQYIQFSYSSVIKIMNMKLKINGYIISYYDKYNPLIVSNKKQAELILKLTHYFKNNYHKSTFFIDQPCIVLDKYDIAAQIFLNDIPYCQWISDESNIFLADIIIVIGVPKTIEEKKQYVMKQILINPIQSKMFSEEAKNTVIKKTEYIFSQIKKQYCQIDMIYLEENNQNFKVTLLGRKDKFQQFF